MKKTVFLLLTVCGVGYALWLQHVSEQPTDKIKLFGNVDIRQVDISFQVGGVIENMLFEEGETVKKGDLLAELDAKDYQDNYQKAIAEVKRQKAIRDEAQSVLDTNLPLCRQSITSKRSCTSYSNALAEAEGALESALVSQRYQKNQLEYTKIYAPDDGIVTSRVQEPGATVKSGQIVYTIAKNRPLWIRTYIPETQLGNVNYNTKARVLTDSINPQTGKRREYDGRVGYISPVAEFTPKTVETQDLRTDLVYRIHVYVDEADEFLRQGMPTTVEIDL
ncbi:MAG: efflux RND transporter periplasmic adaptor subunit [Alphaproteobacteria bacterium]|nr:efflux RND transporter periplasmic adaptor subunit [Alphaproteobacteria bacterium]